MLVAMNETSEMAILQQAVDFNAYSSEVEHSTRQNRALVTLA
jgi:hypothetical protein